MRLVHLSDTHLGFGAYSRLDPNEAINQREADFYHSFQKAIDKAMALKPDIVVHAGDLFDGVRPQNRAIDFALRQLIRLSDEGIETVLISGNHSTPRLMETGSIFRIFEHLPHIHPVHEPGCSRIKIGDLTVHAIPHSVSPTLDDVLSTARRSEETRLNVLMLHAGIVGSNTYKMDEFNEQTVPMERIKGDWDYIALGHYHEFKKVASRTYYSGSTDRLGFGELEQEKGIVEVNLDSGEVKFHQLDIRDMTELQGIDASGLASSEILREARSILSGVAIDEKIVRLVISKVAPEAYRSLDMPAIRRLGSNALHFELKVEPTESEAMKESGTTQIGLLADEFKKYVTTLDKPDEKKSKLLTMGIPYFAREEE